MCVTMIDLILDKFLKLTWIRVFRLLRIARLLRHAEGVGILIKAVFTSLPQITNVLVLCLIILYMYSVIGMALFKDMPRGVRVAVRDAGAWREPGCKEVGVLAAKWGGCADFIRDHVNFDTFFSAVLTLMRITTGEVWSSIMFELRDYCDSQDLIPGVITCGSLTVPFMLSYVVLTQLLLLNIIVAVVLDSYQACLHEYRRVVTTLTIKEFQQTWMELDPKASGYIPVKHLGKLLLNMKEPLHCQRSEEEFVDRDLLPLIHELNFPMYIVQPTSQGRRGRAASHQATRFFQNRLFFGGANSEEDPGHSGRSYSGRESMKGPSAPKGTSKREKYYRGCVVSFRDVIDTLASKALTLELGDADGLIHASHQRERKKRLSRFYEACDSFADNVLGKEPRERSPLIDTPATTIDLPTYLPPSVDYCCTAGSMSILVSSYTAGWHYSVQTIEKFWRGSRARIYFEELLTKVDALGDEDRCKLLCYTEKLQVEYNEQFNRYEHASLAAERRSRRNAEEEHLLEIGMNSLSRSWSAAYFHSAEAAQALVPKAPNV
ncbi:hypothetical protein CYMTET_45798 [Cymbomonas tetramitiformis]|uniref:EF-hand domain-containing protein n=1 Tax=Cymbomonas tetramitiformis TaxID=36881 RepID=A0AAE0EXP5_9CHLO|nr:hypothetical protein CYMTET_45798 [Cymbomonas tetramitiformis]